MKIVSFLVLLLSILVLSSCSDVLSDLVIAEKSSWAEEPASGSNDEEQPLTVTLSAAESWKTNTMPVVLTASFSEGVTGFSLSDIIVNTTDTTVDNFIKVSDSVYTFELSALSETQVYAQINSGVCKSLAQQKDNAAAPTFYITYDTVAPGITSGSLFPVDGSANVAANTDIRIRFNDDMAGNTFGKVTFGTPAIVYEDGTNCTMDFVNTTFINDTLIIRPSVPLAGIQYSSISLEGFTDAAGNPMTSFSYGAYSFKANGLSLYTPYDGTSDDLSGLSRGGTDTVNDPTNDRYGNPDMAYYFDGDLAKDITTDLNNSTDFDGDFTISFWMNTNFSGEQRAILSKDTNTAVFHPYSSEVQVEVTDTDQVRFILGSGVVNTSISVTGTTSINRGQWYHVTCIVRAGEMLIYIDGGLPEDSLTIVTPRINSTEPLVIGVCHDTLTTAGPTISTGFIGSLDDLRVYNYAFTDAQVQSLYDNTKP